MNLHIWSHEFAYAVGLIATDGSLSRDGRHIDFTTKDLQLAELYRQIVRPAAKIGVKLNGSRRAQQYRVQIGDKGLYGFLSGIGVTPRKSQTLGTVDVPKEYYADFLRGCFDGDGSCWSYRDKRYPNSIMYYLSIASASRLFVEWLSRMNTVAVPGIQGHITCSSQGVYQLRYAKAATGALYRLIYYRAGLPCLARKQARLIDFLTNNLYI